jgi:hypothetical protein
MYEYLLTARQPDGRVITQRLEALSGDEAVEELQRHGCTEIVLHTDDVSAVLTKQSKFDGRISPREYVDMRQRGSYLRFVAFLIIKFYKMSWIIHLISLAVFLVRRGWGYPWGFLDWLILAWLVFPLVLGIVTPLFGISRSYTQMIEAVSWGRWNEVLQRLTALRGRIPPIESAVREAQALAGLGHLQEGLRVLSPFADGSQIPEWMYWSRLAEVCNAAHHRDQAMAAIEKAAELAPDNAVVLLDFANQLLGYRRDASRAKLLINRVRTHKISDMLHPLLTMTDGMLELEENRPRKAVQCLEKSLTELNPFRWASPRAIAYFRQIELDWQV